MQRPSLRGTKQSRTIQGGPPIIGDCFVSCNDGFGLVKVKITERHWVNKSLIFIGIILITSGYPAFNKALYILCVV